MSQTVPRQLAFITLYLAGLVAAPSRGELRGAALSPASAGLHVLRCGSRQPARSNLQRAIYIAAEKTEVAIAQSQPEQDNPLRYY